VGAIRVAVAFLSSRFRRRGVFVVAFSSPWRFCRRVFVAVAFLSSRFRRRRVFAVECHPHAVE
jgi:hypothetical protein